MNDVDFGTVRLKQDVGPGIYTNTYACQFHSHSLSLLLSAVHFGVFHWSSLHAGFQRSTLHQSNHKKSHSTLKGERVKFLVYPVFLHFGGKNTGFWKVQVFYTHFLLVRAKGTWIWLDNIGGTTVTGKPQSTRTKTCPIITSSTANHTRTDPGPNWYFRGERTATNPPPLWHGHCQNWIYLGAFKHSVRTAQKTLSISIITSKQLSMPSPPPPPPPPCSLSYDRSTDFSKASSRKSAT